MKEDDAKCFKMHRKSKAASNLKSAISSKLRHFLPNYSDDVLAEYITVLVCNGKDQCQARDELDAFLGETTAEFVSWLWGYLLEYSFETNEYLGFSRPKPPTATDRDKDLPIDISSHNLLTNRLPSSLRGSILSNNMEFAEASTRHPGFAPDKLLSKTFENESLTFQYFVNGSSTVIQANRQQQIVCSDKPKKHTVHRDELSYLLERVPISRNLQSSTSEYHCLKQICANNVSPPSTGALSRQNGKSQGSVWDRLGKPCDNTSARGEIAEAHCVDATKQDKKVLNQQTLMLPMLNGKPCRKILLGPGPGHRNRSTGNYCSKSRERGVSITCKPQSANTIGQKRHFDEISSGPATNAAVADSLVGERGMDHLNKEISEEVKKSILAVKDSKTTSDIVSKTLDLKQKVQQIEMEMSKLRSKQAEKRKGVKPNSSSHSDTVKHLEKDVESRTVFVTNVHFAASEQALSLYFAKCGMVDNVVILTNEATGQPKGSAYVTFASEESVDKALGLSRTSFFSRSIKVVRKAEADSTAAAPTQLALSLSLAPVSYLSRKAIPRKPYYSSGHMQWRRDSNSALSDPYAPLIFAGKETNSSSQ